MYDENGYDENGENEYMKLGWENNVKNCNVPIERSIMISDDQYESEYDTLEAGIVLGELEITSDQYDMHACGKWWWLEFEDKEIAMAFKLRWL